MIDDRFSPVAIISFRSGANDYVLTSDAGSTSFLYDVTAPANPVLVRTLPFGLQNRWAKANNGNGICLITAERKLLLYDPATLVSAGVPAEVLPPLGTSWVDVTTDGTAFYGLTRGGGVSRVSSTGITSVIDSGYPGFALRIGYGGGYLVVHANDPSSPPRRIVVFYRVGSTPTARLDDSSFFRSSYTSNFTFFILAAAQIYVENAQTFMVGPYFGLGDVYSLTSGLSSTDLGLSQTAPITATFGQTVAYDLTVSNGGSADASGVALTDTLPSNATFAGFSAPGWTCSHAAGPLICTMPALAAGASSTIHVTVTAPSTIATLTNASTVAIDNPDTNSANNSATAATAVLSPASVSATKAVSGTPLIGNEMTYTVVLTNAGPSTQFDNPGDEFSDTLPANLTLNGASATAGSIVTNTASKTVSWNGALIAGASATITISATLVSGAVGTIVSNQGTVHYDADGNGTNEANALTDDPSVAGIANPTQFAIARAVLIAGTMTVDDPTRVYELNDTVTYHVTLTNNGPRAQNDNPGDELTDALPSALSVMSATASSGTISTDPSGVHWNGSIPAAGAVSINIIARLTAIPASLTIANQATISSDANGDGVNDTSSTTNATTISFDSAAIPLLSPEMLILMAACLGAIGFIATRKT